MTVEEIKARKFIAGQTTERLITQFELTDLTDSKEVYMVRGWLMDELEKRNPEAFWKWVDSEEESPRKFF
jgi:hypothetical protein